jgi:uncharacterized protein YuzE
MKVSYDAQTDILRIILNNTPIEESDENHAGVILDYDTQGNVVGIEILSASQRVDNPLGVEFNITRIEKV